MSHEDQTPYTTRGAWPAPDDEPAVTTSAPAASLPRANAPSAAAVEWEDITAPLEPLNVTGKDGASYGATELALWITERLAHNDRTGDDWEVIPEAIDAYAAAALTQEQRDVLTVWEWCKKHHQGSLWLEDSEGHPRPFSRFLHGETWMQQAAAWVRAQGGE